MICWFRECLQRYIEDRFGKKSWQNVLERVLSNPLGPTGLSRLGKKVNSMEDDEIFDALLAASSATLGVSTDSILEGVGCIFIRFVRWEGFEYLLDCQGSTLQGWLNNVNKLHNYVGHHVYSGMKKPVILCEDEEGDNGTFLIHYQSTRGSKLAQLVVGIVKEVANDRFNTDIDMIRLKTQGIDDEEFTTWLVSPINSPCVANRMESPQSVPEHNPDKEHLDFMYKHPISISAQESDRLTDSKEIKYIPTDIKHERQGNHHCRIAKSYSADIQVSGGTARSLFPYHIVVDQSFHVLQIGNELPKLLQRDIQTFLGRNIGEIITITGPCSLPWQWNILTKLRDQCISFKSTCGFIKLVGTMVELSNHPCRQVLFILNPDAKDVSDLKDLNLKMSDLSIHSLQHDVVFLGEHIAIEIVTQKKLDQMTTDLRKAKGASNALLFSLLPRNIACQLRDGNFVDPKHHENVTLVRVEMVDFSFISSNGSPLDLINLLNRYYSFLDFLSHSFGLIKIESKHGIFVACDSLCDDYEKSSDNVANFAIAALYLSRQLPAHSNKNAFSLRIGIHTGQCLSAIVGMVSPRFCLFGATVDATKTLTKSCEQGKILCSSLSFGRFKNFSCCANDQFMFNPRGLVEMDNQSKLFTYWLVGSTPENTSSNTSALEKLAVELSEALARQNTAF